MMNENGKRGEYKNEDVLIVPKSSSILSVLERPHKDFPKVYSLGSLPPPDITPDESDPASALDMLTLDSNFIERERAKVWMRTAHFHAGNEAYWKDRSSQEFARTERMLWQSGFANILYRGAAGMLGMGVFQWPWLVASTVFFLLALVFDQQIKKDIKE